MAGWIGFHRRVVVLAGVPAVWVDAVCLLTVAGVVVPAGGLALTAMMLVPYVAVLGMRRADGAAAAADQVGLMPDTAEISIL